MDISRAMLQLVGSSVPWTCGDTYASIRMLDVTPKPTEEALNAAWQAYLATPKPRSWATADFFARFTDDERAALVLSDDPQMRVLRYTLSLHPTVESDNADLLSGLAYAVSIGLLTEDRKNAILNA